MIIHAMMDLRHYFSSSTSTPETATPGPLDTQSQLRLTGLALQHINRNISVDVPAIIDEFSRRHPRTLKLINIKLSLCACTEDALTDEAHAHTNTSSCIWIACDTTCTLVTRTRHRKLGLG